METLDKELADKHILHVENISTLRSAVQSMLKELGFKNVEQATDGLNALDKLKHRTFDLIISDWDMPRLDGLGLLKHIRMDERLHAIPFILISGIAEYKLVKQAMQFGVNEYVVKPFTPKLLFSKVTRSISSNVKNSSIYPQFESDGIKDDGFHSQVAIVTPDDFMRESVSKLIPDGIKSFGFPNLKQSIIEIRRNKKIDVVLIDSALMKLEGKSVSQFKTKLESGQVAVVILLRPEHKSNLRALSESGFSEYVEYSSTLFLLPDKISYFQSLKKAMLNMNSMVRQIEKDKHQHLAIEQDLLGGIRRPLQAINEAAEDIANKYSKSSYVEELTNQIRNQSKYVHSMVEILEHLDSVDERGTELEPEIISLYQSVEHAYSSLSPLFKERRIKLVNLISKQLNVIVNPKQIEVLCLLLMQSFVGSLKGGSDLQISISKHIKQNVVIEISGSCDDSEPFKGILEMHHHQNEADAMELTSQVHKLISAMGVKIRFVFTHTDNQMKVQLELVKSES